MQTMYLKIEQVLLILGKKILPPKKIIQDLIRSTAAEPVILTVEGVTVWQTG